MLLRFGGADLTLRNPSLELHRNNAWNKLSPLMPAGITITLRDPFKDPAPSTLQWIPDGTWDRVRLPGHPTTGAQLAVTIHIERGLEVGIRNAMLTSVDGRPQPVIRYPRPKLWFYHPNLLAHTMAMAGLLTTLGPIGIAIGAIPIAAAGLWIIGSRTALITYLAGAVLLLLLRRKRFTWRCLLLPSLATVVLLVAAVLGRVGRFANSDLDVGVSRLEIWRAALVTLSDHPWAGVGFGTPLPVADAVVGHAHNLLLGLGVWYGLPGIAFGLWLSGGLLFCLALSSLDWYRPYGQCIGPKYDRFHLSLLHHHASARCRFKQPPGGPLLRRLPRV